MTARGNEIAARLLTAPGLPATVAAPANRGAVLEWAEARARCEVALKPGGTFAVDGLTGRLDEAFDAEEEAEALAARLGLPPPRAV